MSTPEYKLIEGANAKLVMDAMKELAGAGFRFAGMSTHATVPQSASEASENRIYVMVVKEAGGNEQGSGSVVTRDEDQP